MPEDLSRYLEGNYAPVHNELEVADLPITGELPRGLNGALYRNGPNPQFAPADPRGHHWFLGDGMVHAIALEAGRAGYRNRWVRTEKFEAERAAGRPLGAELRDRGVANTNIVWHGGKLLALEEAHLPIAMDPATLATLGTDDFAGQLPRPFTAHPKVDPRTGELLFFGYSATGPLSNGMTFGTLAADGRVARVERFDAPYCSMVHDFAVTDRHVVFPILPLHGDRSRAMRGGLPFVWEPELGAAVGVVQRDLGVASLRWFRIESCYVFHVLNAWDDPDGRIRIDVMQYDEAPLFPRADGRTGDPAALARLVRWTIDPNSGTDAVSRTQLDDLPGEFPRIDERRAGLVNRYGTIAGSSGGGDALDTIAWLDLAAGTRADFTLPAGDATSEPVFVPRDEAAGEGEGWLLAVVWRAAERRSDLIVLDAQDIRSGPVATVGLPQRVPFGFHGNWVATA